MVKVHKCKNDPICKDTPCKQYTVIGTDEDNNFMTPKKYGDILASYNVRYYYNEKKYILKRHNN